MSAHASEGTEVGPSSPAPGAEEDCAHAGKRSRTDSHVDLLRRVGAPIQVDVPHRQPAEGGDAGASAPTAGQPTPNAAGSGAGAIIKADLLRLLMSFGTDETAIFARIEKATAEELVAVVLDAGLLAALDSDIGDAEFDYWRGLLARRLHVAGADPLAFRMCMGTDARRRKRLACLNNIEDQRTVCDVAICASDDAETVRQAFQSYWQVELRVTTGAGQWSAPMLKAMHGQLRRLPARDARSGVWKQLELTSDPKLTERASYAAGKIGLGSQTNPTATLKRGYGTQLSAAVAEGATELAVKEDRFAVGDVVNLDEGRANHEAVTIAAIEGLTYEVSPTNKSHRANTTVGMTGGGGLRNVNWLDAMVRHEIGHAVEDVVDTSPFKKELGGWWTGSSFDTWAAAMGDPWGGVAVSEVDKRRIRATIEEHVHRGKGTLTALRADHPIRRHWDDNIPVIVAAEACLSRGDDFFAAPTALHQANGKVFTCSRWYKNFQFCNDGVLADRLSNYTLYAPAEFFAENYAIFYEEAGREGVTDEDLGRHVKNRGWADWIRQNVHERGLAPANRIDGAKPAATHGRSADNPI